LFITTCALAKQQCCAGAAALGNRKSQWHWPAEPLGEDATATPQPTVFQVLLCATWLSRCCAGNGFPIDPRWPDGRRRNDIAACSLVGISLGETG